MLTFKEQEILDIVIDLNSKGIEPQYSDIMRFTTSRQTDYNRKRLQNLVRKGYLILHGKRYYAPLTMKGTNVNEEIKVSEASLLHTADKDLPTWFILGFAKYNRPGLPLLRKEVFDHIDIREVDRIFNFLFLVKTLHQDSSAIPTYDNIKIEFKGEHINIATFFEEVKNIRLHVKDIKEELEEETYIEEDDGEELRQPAPLYNLWTLWREAFPDRDASEYSQASAERELADMGIIERVEYNG